MILKLKFKEVGDIKEKKVEIGYNIFDVFDCTINTYIYNKYGKIFLPNTYYNLNKFTPTTDDKILKVKPMTHLEGISV